MLGAIKGINELVRGSKWKSDQCYNYIIVGGGTAGCVLANRLSENGTKSVLLLEAGSNDFNHKHIQVPIGAFRTPHPRFDWGDTSVEEIDLANRSTNFCSGKVLGGSSCTNNLVYNRGDKNDYDSWAKLVGDEEWSADKILHFFKRSEDDFRGTSKYHWTGNEFSVSNVKYQNTLSKAFLSVCSEYGCVENNDFNDWSTSQEGFGRYQVTEKDGTRCTSASAFLAPAMKRKNLTVITNATVVKIVFIDVEATGVVAIIDGVRQLVELVQNGEIFMTAGAINNPHILLHSGVGKRSHLHLHGIYDVIDLPGVGKNLQDQPTALVTYECAPGNEGVSLSSVVRIPGTAIPNPKIVLEWMVNKSGPFTSPGGDHGGFFKTSAKLASPDLQMRFLAGLSSRSDGFGSDPKSEKAAPLVLPTPSSPGGPPSPSRTSSTSDEDCPPPPVPVTSPIRRILSFPTVPPFRSSQPVTRDGFTFQSSACRPLSRGSVELGSDNPADRPVIRTGYFTGEGAADIITLREGIKLSRSLANSPSMLKYTGPEIHPGPKVQSDEELDEYIRNTAHSSNALCGTCKMGPKSDLTAVVGPDLRIHGLRGIRVADASVVPKIPGGEIVAVTVMIAERAAAFVTDC